MAAIRKRGSRWEAQVRRKGYPSLTKSFDTHADAIAWARDQERAIDRAELPSNHRELKSYTVSDLLERYEREITACKRGADRERSKLRVIRSHHISKATLDKVSGAMVAQYRDTRLKTVTSGTARRELAILQHCFEVARKEWGLAIPTNPVRQITLPSPGKARQRRLTPEDLKTFWQAVDRARANWVKPMVILAIETGMRRGELLSIRWENVDLNSRLIQLTQTKNGHERIVPLSPVAIQTLSSISRHADHVFPVKPYAVRQGWDRLVKRAGVQDLRFHDLRHEAVSRLFELGLSVPEVAMVSGHRDPRMLFRYTHPKAELIAAKLLSAYSK
ncbi:integrase [Microvirga vignae]|uniref:Integrase n=1 Tax=Microvirga vignae TaxID=1225564 RepID=A0A0H1RFH0_9HYPH|nr:tyrosine-type recombinase/integrase [Microvirga vignae]KLK93940.1 integrase [Microvirga vignae]